MSKLMSCCSFDSSRQCGRGTDCISDLRSCKGQMACFSEIQQQRKASAALLNYVGAARVVMSFCPCTVTVEESAGLSFLARCLVDWKFLQVLHSLEAVDNCPF